MMQAIKKGHEEIKKITAFINDIVAEIGKPKFEYQSAEVPKELYDAVYDLAYEEMRKAVLTDDKTVRDSRVAALTEEVQQKLAEEFPESASIISEAMYKIEKKIVRNIYSKKGKGWTAEDSMRSGLCLQQCHCCLEHMDQVFSREARHR